MASTTDFSTNRHSASETTSLVRHTDLSFADGNIVILADFDYFLVHRGLLTRHSEVLEHLIKSMDPTPAIEGQPVLSLPEPSDSIACFLQALYDGTSVYLLHTSLACALTSSSSFLTYDEQGFATVASLLRVLTTYKVHYIRHDILRVLSASWPTTLAQWESRECSVTSPDGVYSPHPSLPHPMFVIKLARDIDAPSLLPSAMYDLSRCTPSEAAIGILKPQVGNYIKLDESDLMCVLRGREHASRYFSTFIVNELEGRAPSTSCLRRNETGLLAKRACQMAFEAITFELLRDINGIISHRTSDPLYGMADAELMQTREGASEDNLTPMRTCEICRTEFASTVLAAKEDFWRKLPGWFGVDVPKWARAILIAYQESELEDGMATKLDPSKLSQGCDGHEDDLGLTDDERDHEEAEKEHDMSLETIARIENLTLTILEAIVGSLKKPRRNPEGTSSTAATNLDLPKYGKVEIRIADRRKEASEGCATRILRFPTQNRSSSSKQIAQFLRVMNFAHEALEEGLPLTKRDMYYKDIALFNSQKTVDRLVDDLAATLKLDRADLNIRATSKGLICGSSLVIYFVDGHVLRLDDSEGTLIPAGEDIERFEVEGDVAWVLVVEKEAVFQTLCRLQFTSHPALPGCGLMITGKGYPDLATRQLVRTLSDNLPDHIPIVALVDGDAYGLDILSVYKYGSQSLRHENEKLAAHRIQWLGIKTSELLELGIHLDALIPITKHDEKKAMAMLQRCIWSLPVEWRHEILKIAGYHLTCFYTGRNSCTSCIPDGRPRSRF
ncbi:DNA topoisomerase IV, alpha subunit [Gyrodon lividus]|nr:DNA topoisomerase IV, alpha subunit [Gyrodon lividus]